MTVDISRRPRRPRRNYAGVIQQQGRVQLDSDFNEAFAIDDRQRRARMLDLVGRCGYPRGLPESFRIAPDGASLSIGPGRYYVDGLLAENFGRTAEAGGAERFDLPLEETRSDDAVPFAGQPFRPDAAAPEPAPGRHLVYLDVWRRAVTFLEDPELLEIAVGVDTTAREQTVWQVRTLANMPADATCSTPDAALPGWLDATRPSDGRLSVFEVPQDEPDDPCELPPGAGYRALENRTYRVEIHDRGPDGRWRFKWSRHNATVATRVLAVLSARDLAVARVAKDDVLRFEPGDWVEILDDRMELEGEPGIMRMVDVADPATDRITLRTDIPAGLFPTDADGTPTPDRNLRVRKWSQSGAVSASGGTGLADLTDPNADGVVPLPPAGEFVRLEAGIAVAFSLAPGGAARFRNGDFWTFVARTADASVEALDEAPPDGTHHHYCRLAFVDADGEVFLDPPAADCRVPFPEAGGEGCCTVVVAPGESIQAAIDSLPPAGGCVCLKAGLHVVSSTVVIARDDVRLTGESRGAVVRLSGEDPVLAVRGAAYAFPVERVRVEGIGFEGGAVSPSSGVLEATFAADLSLADCGVATIADSQEHAFAGIRVAGSRGVWLTRCHLADVRVGVWATVRSGEVSVRDCRLDLSGAAGLAGILADRVVGWLDVAGNVLSGALLGVVIDDDPDGPPSSLARGSIVRENRIALRPADEGERDVAPDLAGISCAADDCRIEGNAVLYAGPGNVGIAVTGSGARVVDNRCRASAGLRGAEPGVGIAVGVPPERGERRIANVLVRGNAVSGAQSGVVVGNAAGVTVEDTIVETVETGQPTAGLLAVGGRDVAFRENRVDGAAAGIGAASTGRLAVEGNRVAGGAVGIAVLFAESPTVSGNRVDGAASWGIAVFGAIARTSLAANRAIGCGYRAGPGIGIGAYAVLGELELDRNEVMNTGNGPDGERAAVAIGLFADLVLEARVAGNLVTYSGGAARDVTGEDRALQMRGLLEQSFAFGDRQIVFGFPVKILGNSFVGTGFTALVELREQALSDTLRIRFERVTFSDNHCFHFAPPQANDIRGTVSLEGRRGIVMGNHVKATTPDYFSFNLNGMPSTYLGNVVENVAIQGSTTPATQGESNIET